MNSFKYNGVDVRLIEISAQEIYFVTSDANDAFGFAGQNTRLDKLSVRLDSLSKDMNYILSTEPLAKNTLVILLSDLVKGIVKSGDDDLASLGDALVQMASHRFTEVYLNQKDRPMLPAVSDHVRLERTAGVTASKYYSPHADEPVNRIDLPGWMTVTEMLAQIDPRDEDSIIKGSHFRYWANTRFAEKYREIHSNEPPRNKRGTCLYPPSFLGLVGQYVAEWLKTRDSIRLPEDDF
jgi:hypothetical protein